VHALVECFDSNLLHMAVKINPG